MMPPIESPPPKFTNFADIVEHHMKHNVGSEAVETQQKNPYADIFEAQGQEHWTKEFGIRLAQKKPAALQDQVPQATEGLGLQLKQLNNLKEAIVKSHDEEKKKSALYRLKNWWNNSGLGKTERGSKHLKEALDLHLQSLQNSGRTVSEQPPKESNPPVNEQVVQDYLDATPEERRVMYFTTHPALQGEFDAALEKQNLGIKGLSPEEINTVGKDEKTPLDRAKTKEDVETLVERGATLATVNRAMALYRQAYFTDPERERSYLTSDWWTGSQDSKIQTPLFMALKTAKRDLEAPKPDMNSFVAALRDRRTVRVEKDSKELQKQFKWYAGSTKNTVLNKSHQDVVKRQRFGEEMRTSLGERFSGTGPASGPADESKVLGLVAAPDVNTLKSILMDPATSRATVIEATNLLMDILNADQRESNIEKSDHILSTAEYYRVLMMRDALIYALDPTEEQMQAYLRDNSIPDLAVIQVRKEAEEKAAAQYRVLSDKRLDETWAAVDAAAMNAAAKKREALPLSKQLKDIKREMLEIAEGVRVKYKINLNQYRTSVSLLTAVKHRPDYSAIVTEHDRFLGYQAAASYIDQYQDILLAPDTFTLLRDNVDERKRRLTKLSGEIKRNRLIPDETKKTIQAEIQKSIATA